MKELDQLITYIENDLIGKHKDIEIIDEAIKKYAELYHAEQLRIGCVVKSLPTLEEANIELKDFVETYYTEKETKARLECAIGFKHCYRWLSKISTK